MFLVLSAMIAGGQIADKTVVHTAHTTYGDLILAGEYQGRPSAPLNLLLSWHNTTGWVNIKEDHLHLSIYCFHSTIQQAG